MSDNLTSDAVLRMLQHDLDFLEAQERGKQRDQQDEDLALAIKCMRDDIFSAETASQDEVLARSISAATASDQMMLATLDMEERSAARDHEFAVALNNGVDTPAFALPDAAPENRDGVCSAINEVFARAGMNDAPNDNARQLEDTDTTLCYSCLETFSANDLFRGPCGHGYCRDCAKKLFTGAMVDEQLYPPRCCGRAFQPATALTLLDYVELRTFCEKAIEWTTVNRVYCADPRCSKFIPPWAIQNDIGTCQGCDKRTHSPCRSLEHSNAACPQDEGLYDVLALAEREKWKRCFHCQTMVELQWGCNHITCRCGREFCYICGDVWRTCDCPVWDESRIIHLANQIVREEAPANANEADRRVVFDRAVADIQRRERRECQHHNNDQWARLTRGNLQCEMCDWEGDLYIYGCRNCRMKVCHRCRFNRLR